MTLLSIPPPTLKKYTTVDQDTIWTMILIPIVSSLLILVLLFSLFVVYEKQDAKKGPFIGIVVTVLLLLCLSITLLFDNVFDNIQKEKQTQSLPQEDQHQRTFILDLKQVRINSLVTAIMQMVAGVLCLISFGFIKEKMTSQIFFLSTMILVFATVIVNFVTLSKYFVRNPKK